MLLVLSGRLDDIAHLSSAWDRMSIYYCSFTKIRLHSNGYVTLRHLSTTDHL